MKKFFRFIFFSLFFFAAGMFAQDSLYLQSIFHGENDKDQFGVVANVGDVNGDGFEDLMIGAPGASRNLYTDPPTRGYAKLYYGGTVFDTIPDITFNYYGAFTTFGATIAGDGDLNGDGYDDFAIADPTYGSYQVGKVYVFFGGPQLDTIPDVVLTLNPNKYFYTRFGLAMTMNGDINHDKYDDLVVGAAYDDWDRHGEVFIYFGGTQMDAEADINLICKTPLQEFGLYVDYAGDVNEDFIDDLVVGSYPLESDTTTFIFFGNKNLDIGFHNSYAFTSPVQGIITSLGDINGDGYSDFAVGSHLFAAPIKNGHLIEILIENPDSINYTIKARCPDLNKDGYEEILCSSSKAREENVLIIFGGNKPSLTNAIIFKDPDDKIGFGRHITSCPKLLNDTTISIIIGDTETYDYNTHGTGKVIIYNDKLITGVANDESSVKNIDFTLSQNYPNPFNPSTQIQYALPSTSNVIVTVYNSLGQIIKVFNEGTKEAGNHNITFNGEGLSSGIYLYSVNSVSIDGKQNFTAAKKMLLLK
ncbi:MAG: T9SS type A sorting domain-containing protein [Ignavibacteria bacterium]|nr:T9SS type A sorting domain-containing protein [Ignavibacteria bacterium]PIX93259.1 MAG: hypothetical protein COZ25_11460 [Ignavibacteria bacterium CG_4_10_14_3_um_filter_37_18]